MTLTIVALVVMALVAVTSTVLVTRFAGECARLRERELARLLDRIQAPHLAGVNAPTSQPPSQPVEPFQPVSSDDVDAEWLNNPASTINPEDDLDYEGVFLPLEKPYAQ